MLLAGCGGDDEGGAEPAASASASGPAASASASGSARASASASASGSAPAAAGATITIRNFEYLPDPFTGKVGDSVTVTNQDSVEHTWTAKDGTFDSGDLEQNGTFEYTFDKAGNYDVICTYHPTMAARVEITS